MPASSRKRKASESSGDDGMNVNASSSSPMPAAASTGAKKKSKRQSMDEQRAAAKEWAEQRKRDKAAKAARAGSGTPAATSASSSPMAVIRETMSTTPTPLTGPTGTPVVKTRATPSRNPVPAAASSSPAAYSSSSHSGGHSGGLSPKEAKRAKIAAGKERARQWAEEQRAKKTPVKASSHSAVTGSTSESNARPFRSTTRAKTASTGTSIPLLSPPAGFLKEEQEQPQLKQLAEEPTPTPTITTTTTTVVVEEKMEFVPILTPNKVEEEPYEEEVYEPPPTPSAEDVDRLINGPDVEAEVEADEVIEDETETSATSASGLVKGIKWITTGILRFVGFAASCYFLSIVYHDLGVTVVKVWNNQDITSSSSSSSSWSVSSSSSEKPIYCYVNDLATQANLYPNGDNLSPAAAPPMECTNHPKYDLSRLPRKPCPEHGICYDGMFQQCSPSHLFNKVVGERARGKYGPTLDPRCGLTPLGQALVQTMETVVEELTLECICGSCSSTAMDGSSNATFWLMDVVDAMGHRFIDIPGIDGPEYETVPVIDLPSFPNAIHLLLGHLQKVDLLEEPHGEGLKRLVKLSPSADASLYFPWGCWLSLWATYFLNLFGAVVLSVLGLGIRLVVDFPLPTLVVTLISVGTWNVYTERRRRVYVVQQAAEAQSVAYDKLIYESQHGSNKGYGIPILREDVAQTLHPRSLKLRKSFSKNIWPRVSIEMKADIRIQTIQRSIGGNVMDCWIWNGNRASETSTPSRS
jgi:hypothetical protein